MGMGQIQIRSQDLACALNPACRIATTTDRKNKTLSLEREPRGVPHNRPPNAQQSSWNPYWGEKGHFRIRRGNGECGFEEEVVFSSAEAVWGKTTHV